jgi:hypothetical protein
MTTTYGATPQGFARKPLAQILADIEDKARLVFGSGVIQTPESPLGQLNGLMASIIATSWEVAEDAYQSYDPDQSDGVRLDQLARIRLLERGIGESDIDLRAAVTNAGRARIDLADIYRAVKNVDGVSFVNVVVNDRSTTDATGIDPHSICVCVVGGTDAEVAAAIRPYIVPGIGTFGNTLVSVNVDGFCRPIMLTRPTVFRLGLVITVKESADRMGCPPPDLASLRQAISDQINGPLALKNGEAMTMHKVRMAASCNFPNIEVLSASATLPPDEALIPLPVAATFDQIFSVSASDITVVVSE